MTHISEFEGPFAVWSGLDLLPVRTFLRSHLTAQAQRIADLEQAANTR